MNNSELRAPTQRAPRYRGRLFIALHGNEDAIRGIAVCKDWLTACMALSQVSEGDIDVLLPSEGGELRRYFEGGEPTDPVPMFRYRETATETVARLAQCTEQYAGRIMRKKLACSTGIGGEIFRTLESIRQDPAKRREFAAMAGWRP